jgi:hypothetical protein
MVLAVNLMSSKTIAFVNSQLLLKVSPREVNKFKYWFQKIAVQNLI